MQAKTFWKLKTFGLMVSKLIMWLVVAGIIHGGVGNFYANYCVPHGVLGHLMGWVTMGSPACLTATQLMSWGHQFACAWWLGAVAIVIGGMKNMVTGYGISW